jgi:hypothetical protein
MVRRLFSEDQSQFRDRQGQRAPLANTSDHHQGRTTSRAACVSLLLQSEPFGPGVGRGGRGGRVGWQLVLPSILTVNG